MSDLWREYLYIPLGVLPAVFFGLRWVVQWLQSERAGRPTSTQAFWWLSLAGNVLLATHYVVQVQFPFAMLQVLNGVISWRNLNILRSSRPLSTRAVLWIAVGTSAALMLLFTLQSTLMGEWDWVRIPVTPLSDGSAQLALSWHLFGSVGAIVFSSRFWWQWWMTERHMSSELGLTFWLLSLSGSLLTLIYLVQIGDPVSLMHHSLAAIPSLRNLMLLRRQRAGVVS